ncbi:MAG: class I SAM-dependent methyltransferase [Spirochaetales bacterium]|nr:class I SAM-dependent methyltransferase [Spirochaetales bacterium]
MSNNEINIIKEYYNQFDEENRLTGTWGRIEFVRSQIIIQKYLKKPPAVILDIGGAAGIYSCWLSRLDDYEVHLIDPVPKHVEAARKASSLQKDRPLTSCTIGNALDLQFEDNFADIILLMDPLYHLQNKQDRIKALQEAYRVLQKGGIIFAVGISKFASIIDGFCSGNFTDKDFLPIMMQDLKNGKHKNTTDNQYFFTDSYFHFPGEIKEEMEQAGFNFESMIGIEGIAYTIKDLEKHWENSETRSLILQLLSKLESEPALIGASPHIMYIGKKI